MGARAAEQDLTSVHGVEDPNFLGRGMPLRCTRVPVVGPRCGPHVAASSVPRCLRWVQDRSALIAAAVAAWPLAATP